MGGGTITLCNMFKNRRLQNSELAERRRGVVGWGRHTRKCQSSSKELIQLIGTSPRGLYTTLKLRVPVIVYFH